MSRISEEKLEQDQFDPLVDNLLENFEAEFKRYKSKDTKSAIHTWLAKQGVNDSMQYNITENEVVIGAKAQSPKQVNGPCVVRYKDGTVYVGNLTNTMRHGFGYRTYPKSDLVYAGEYFEDKKQGIGRIYSLKRKVWGFKGQYGNDMRNGHGRWEKADGNTYTGNFVNEKLHGYGIQTWPNGDRYEGNFEKDFKNGFGKMIWSNGDMYEGNFKDNTMEGQGKYIWKNGEFYEGQFSKGSMAGHGVIDYTSTIGIKGQGADVTSIRHLNFDLTNYQGPNKSIVH